MKIVLFNSFSPLREYAFKIHAALQKLGEKNVDLFYTHYDDLTFNNPCIQKIWPTKLPFFRQLLNDWIFYPRKMPLNYEIYHMTNQGCSVYIKYLPKTVNTLVTIHDLVPFASKNSFRNIITRKIVKYSLNADRIVAISENTKNDIIKYLQIPSEKINVIYNGISHDVFYPRNKTKAKKEFGLVGKKIILHVTIDEPRKNISTILKAIANLKLKYPEILLVRVGKNRKGTLKLMRSLGLENNFLSLGYLEEEVLAKWYNVADIFVFPSSYEGFGLPPLEAMASGCPVISSNSTSLKEVLGDAALIIDPLNPLVLEKAIIEVFNNKKLNKSLIAKGLKQSKKFTWEKCAREYLKLYKSL